MVSSTSAANNLTVSNAASGNYALKVMTVVAVVITPVVLAYQIWNFYVFRKRIASPKVSADQPLPHSCNPGDHLMSDESPKPTVVIVGAGFAGVACAKELAKHDVPVTLIDRHNYQQFQPLLYQVATAELGTTDIARPIRAIFAKDPSVSMRQLDVTRGRPRDPHGHHRRRRDVHRRLCRRLPRARSRTSSARQAPPNTPSRCIRCPTRRSCAAASSSFSRKRPRTTSSSTPAP